MSMMWNPRSASAPARSADAALVLPVARHRLRADVWEALLAANVAVWAATLYWLVR